MLSNNLGICYMDVYIILSYTRIVFIFLAGSKEKQDSFDSSDDSDGSSSSPTPKPRVVATSPVVSGQKRQPCVYFLSGYCRNGPACPDFHGMDPDLEEFEVHEVY